MALKINISSVLVTTIVAAQLFAATGKSFNDSVSYQSHQTENNIASLPGDTTSKTKNTDTINLHYPIYDRITDFFTTPNKNAFDLKDPSVIKQDVTYDPETNEYGITEKIGDQFYRNPDYMSMEDFLKYVYDKSNHDYWKERSSASKLLTGNSIVPPVDIHNQLIDRIFRGNSVDIKPNGNIDLTFGGNYQNIQNPTLTRDQQKQGGFKFDMNINMNVVGQIGDAMKLTTNYNTQATFDFENQVKLEYTGDQESIIKKIEAGNVSLPLSGSLIPGSQSLFGLKTQLQFGRLTVTSVISQQKSQAQNITVQGGAQTQTFAITADQYDENRNFLLGQYFKDHYNSSLATLPNISSGINITKVEVWVTNKTGTTTDTRDIVAFMDLGESQPYSQNISSNGLPLPYAYSTDPSLNSNDLYTRLTSSPGYPNTRGLNSVIQTLTGPSFGLVPVQDFEKTYARKLSPTEYTINQQLGFIMLNQQLNPDEVLAVAYQYTYQGKVYQVGEFASDIPPNTSSPNVLFLKMLKSTSTRPKLPIWNLMMKNIYSLGAYQINSEDFHLDIYYQDPGGGERRYIPDGNVNGTPLLRLLGLDKLNNQNDPQPDGIFDFMPGITINPSNGKVIFPVLEPFGADLKNKFTDPNVASKYVYQVLYDSTKTIALQFPEFDRYNIKGTYKSSVTSEISLGAFNVPKGSVTVSAGGQKLVENVDFTVDYNLGRVKILNQGVLNSGVPINVQFENNALFSFQTKTLFGTRFDYYINDKFKLGGTYMHLSERPITQKLNAGDDPISNAVYGIDGSFNTEAEWLTQWIDKIPLISTKEKSTITLTAEVAQLNPGHSKAIGKSGSVYIDDFEGTQSEYDLKFPYSAWALASTPSQYPNHPNFNDGNLIDSLAYGYHRAELSWYTIDPQFQRDNAQTPPGVSGNTSEIYNFYTRLVDETEIFPNKQALPGTPTTIATFDLNYEPMFKGPYNYLAKGLSFDSKTGRLMLPNPSDNWAGVQRDIDYNDFEAANIEYIQFWVLDPYLENSTSTGGDLYINLGNVSEDVMKDSRMFYENGLPTATGGASNIDSSAWGRFPTIPPITNSFDTDPNSREFQDVGYDGFRDADEKNYFTTYLDSLQLLYGQGSILNTAIADASNDDYRYFNDDYYNTNLYGILERYKKYNGPDGNSPVSQPGQSISNAATNIPESEDLNRDNTLSETEEYFQYRVAVKPNMQVGTNYITDIVSADVSDNQGNVIGTERWYQFKIPIEDYQEKVGNIQDFKSIRFVRIFMTGFEDTCIMRFAKLELVRNNWRKYLFSLQTPGEYIPGDNNNSTFFNVTSVSLEENSSRSPVNYVIPPGITQEQLVGATASVLQNEQALSLQVCDLLDGDARAVYKSINLDIRQYDTLKLFVHAESSDQSSPLAYGDVSAFVRLGTDFVSNYYEYELPLTITAPGSYSNTSLTDREKVWPDANNFNILLDSLTAIKEKRNNSNTPLTTPFRYHMSNGAWVTVVGNPDLGLVKTAMLGVRNPKKGPGSISPDDDGESKCAEVWFNEMRLNGFNENGGSAALGRLDVKLADLGQITIAGSMHTVGWGTLEQKLNERFKDNYFQYDASGTFKLDKFTPKNWGLQIPMYVGISNSYSTPQYDPYELDILLKQKLSLIADQQVRDSVKSVAQDFVSIKSLNFTNIRKQAGKGAKPWWLSISNFNATYSFTSTQKHNPTISDDLLIHRHGELGYAYPGKSKYILPFTKVFGTGKLSNSKWVKPVKDFNFNFVPTNLSFRTALDRQYGETYLRPISSDEIILPTFNKFFTMDRLYGFKFDFTKSLNMDYNATVNSRIDEPYGKLDTQEKKDTVWTNLKNFGRSTAFHHATNLNYTIPLNKLPLTDWITSTFRYGSDYTWTAAPLVLDTINGHSMMVDNPWGNTISNTQTINFTGDANFHTLYAKFKWLKKYDTNYSPSTKGNTPIKGNGKDDTKNPDTKNPDTKDQTTTDTKTTTDKKTTSTALTPQGFFIRMLLSVKRVNMTYAETHNTILPGFNFKPGAFGQSFSKGAPGFDFVLGMQPDTNWLNSKAGLGWFTHDTTLNYQFVQNSTKNITGRITVEPLKDVMIDLNFSSNSTLGTTEYFKNTTDGYQHLNRMQTGTFTVSYVAINTAFIAVDNNGNSPVFNNFEDYRTIISKRWSDLNPYSAGVFADTLQQYYQGYGPYSQDVLIPAFLAAYTGKDPNTISLSSPTSHFPLPNWRLTYNGLTKLKWAKHIWSSFNVSHAYTSTFSVGAFSSSLDFQGSQGSEFSYPKIIDPNSGNFISYFDIPSISLSENFSPLLGLDATWKNSMTTKFEFKKSRNITMSFLDYQLSEMRSSEVTVGFGYRWKNAPIPWKIHGKIRKLKNDLNISTNVSVMNNITRSYRLDQVEGLPTTGMTMITISPAVDYVVNDRLNLRFFLDKTYNVPATSASYPIKTTNGGVTLRFTLAQ